MIPSLIAAVIEFLSILAVMPVRVQVTPEVCISPCQIQASIVVNPRPQNRYVVIEVDGEEFHSHMIQLEGEKGPKRITFNVLIRTPGEYQVKVILYNITKEYSRDVRTLIVK